uniref:HSA domain-containing protein n=1 Tax=Physcomitrium patens TaxID=3218 RepID=A0A2K1KQP8_PHYPA|nr:hypothetical protein PHYPA_006994 [Physcomitrium patens]
MVNMSYQVLSHQNTHALSSKWNGLASSQQYEPVGEIIARCGPVLEQHASELSSRDKASAPSVQAIQSFDVRVDSRVGVTERISDISSLTFKDRSNDLADRQETHGLTVASWERSIRDAGANRVGGSAAEDVHTNASEIVEGNVGTVEQATERRDRVGSMLCLPRVDVGRVSDSAASLRGSSNDIMPENHRSEAQSVQGMLESCIQSAVDGLSGALAHKDGRIVKKAAFSRGGNKLKMAHRGRVGVDAKKGNNHHLSLNSEEGVSEDRTNHLATEAESRGQGNIGAHPQALRTGVQAGAPRIIELSTSISGALNCMYPGVVLPWEKGQVSAIQSEADRRNADLTNKLANKAREDFILEKAEHLKGKRKLIEEGRTLKKIAELSRRKSHWDFVLEEMRWMANDFWQERMWKRYQAAHVCLEIAMKKGEDEFLAARLLKEQRRISNVLAHAVKDFWHSAEVEATKEITGTRISTKEQSKRRSNETEVIPMEVDSFVNEEESLKSVHIEKAGNEKPSGLQKYAIQLLKESGFAWIGQAEVPSTPKRYRESISILEQVHEVPLFYKVPVGVMEAYRIAVEAEYARSEKEYEKRQTVSITEAGALAGAEAPEEAGARGGVSYRNFLNDGGSQEDEPTAFTIEGSRIAKKKRRKVFKTGSVDAKSNGSGLQGLSYRLSGVRSSELGIPSPLVAEKLSICGDLGPNSLTGSIPVKRARSSAANSRPRGTHCGTSPGAVGLPAQKGFGLSSQQDDDLPMDDSSEGDINSDSPSSEVVGGDSKQRKKKKTKSYQGLSFYDVGKSVKDIVGIAYDLRPEQGKRNAETPWVTIGESDGVLNALVASGSPSISGQKNSKKQKSVRQAEENLDTTDTSGLHSEQQVASGVSVNYLNRHTSMRDGHRRVRPKKVLSSTLTGVGIPWSASEDQAILALVIDLGPNWELVSDVLSSNSQLKGIYRKPQQCKERHKALMERVGVEELENSEDPTSTQQQFAKGIVRDSRGQCAAEEDTLKHFQQIIIIVQKYGAQKTPSECKDQKLLQSSHPSHEVVISQFCYNVPPDPVQLADWVTSPGDGFTPHLAHGFQGSVAGAQSVGPIPGLGMRPSAGGHPLPPVLQATNSSHLVGGPVSPAFMSTTASRDGQRFTVNSTNPPNEEDAKLQMATSKLTEFDARRVQQQAGSVASGSPVLRGLSNSNGLLMSPSSTSGAMVTELNYGLSLPRSGLGCLNAAGLNGMLTSSGNFVGSNRTRRIAGLVNLARSCTEEQRLLVLQELQSLAQQGETQAASALSSLMGDMTNAVDGSNQSFVQHQQSLQQQQQQQQPGQHRQLQHHHQHTSNSSTKLQAQMQQHSQPLPVSSQSYNAGLTRMKDPQQQQHQRQQQQQKQILLRGHPAISQAQHMVVSPLQPGVPSFSSQNLNPQSHILSPKAHNTLQKHLMQQVSGPSQGSQVLDSANMQSSLASPAGLVQQNKPDVQITQDDSGDKDSQPKQMQKQAQQTTQQVVQQQDLRNGKGGIRGTQLMQGVSPQTGPGQANTLSGNVIDQLQGEAGGQLQAGQKVVGQSVGQAAKAASGPQVGTVPGGSQGGQVGQVHGVQSPSVSSVVGLQKVSQQVQQAAQGVINKAEQGSLPQAGGQSSGQQAGSGASSSQQAVSTASPVGLTQQCQQLWGRHVAQAAAPRRLPMRHPSSSVGMPMPGQLGKTVVKQTSAQQTGQGGPSQMTLQAGQNRYQLGGTIPMGMSDPNFHFVGLPSVLNLSTGEAQGSQWKTNQAIAHLPGRMYNLTRTSSSVSGQFPMLASSTMHSNGNTGMSSLAGSGIQGVGLGSMARGVGGVQGDPGLANLKVGAGPGMNGRGFLGSQVGIMGGQRNPVNGSVGDPAGVGSTPSSHVNPPAGSSMPASRTSSSAVGASQSGVVESRQGVSTHFSNPAASSGQMRQTHGGHPTASSSSLVTSSEMAGASGTSGITKSSIPGSGVDHNPPAASREAGTASS